MSHTALTLFRAVEILSAVVKARTGTTLPLGGQLGLVATHWRVKASWMPKSSRWPPQTSYICGGVSVRSPYQFGMQSLDSGQEVPRYPGGTIT